MRELWSAEQVCGECGEGVFPEAKWPAPVLCTVCEHEHEMNTLHLDANERFVWRFSTQATAWAFSETLHVVSYA